MVHSRHFSEHWYSCAHTCATALPFFVSHCKHYHVKVNSREKVQMETKRSAQTFRFRLKFLSAVEFYASNWLPCGDAYIEQMKFLSRRLQASPYDSQS